MKPKEPIPIVDRVSVLSQEVREAQTKAEIINAAKRQAERQAAYAAWSDPEAMAERQKKHEEEAAAALERGKALAAAARSELGLPDDDPPLPDPLPKHMIGQSPATIRAMLRHERGQTARLKTQLKLEGISVVEIEKPPPPEEPKAGLVARILAGLFRR